MIPTYNLIDLVRRGELNFEYFVERLRDPGYIVEGCGGVGGSLAQSPMDQASKDDLKRLFEFFYPTVALDIELKQAATDEGGQPGAFTNALFNADLVSRDDVLQRLRRHNKAHNAQ